MPPPEIPPYGSGDPGRKAPHIVLLPSAGMGHLTPFCRLAVALSNSSCAVSFVTIHPTVSSAESRRVAALLAAYPRLRPLDFQLADFDPSAFNSTDPFFLRFETIRRSAHLLPDLPASASPRSPPSSSTFFWFPASSPSSLASAFRATLSSPPRLRCFPSVLSFHRTSPPKPPLASATSMYRGCGRCPRPLCRCHSTTRTISSPLSSSKTVKFFKRPTAS